ncbi:hypothetical protein Q7C36_006816 [Tachysurus vachellii]|uniref:Uncharacterized protein n=1 Tax=Tachysurus vachellii TaxID=175792 RepID=A0AA88NA26_TACVA|nr:hypothetical protein Q7C36_006816 [Tachysurus vachellii]
MNNFVQKEAYPSAVRMYRLANGIAAGYSNCPESKNSSTVTSTSSKQQAVCFILQATNSVINCIRTGTGSLKTLKK